MSIRLRVDGDELDEVRLSCGSEAPMPHSAVWIHRSWVTNDFWNGKIDIVSIADPNRDATVSCKCSMNLQFIMENMSYACFIHKY